MQSATRNFRAEVKIGNIVIKNRQVIKNRHQVGKIPISRSKLIGLFDIRFERTAY
jgi:hypothetical protein